MRRAGIAAAVLLTAAACGREAPQAAPQPAPPPAPAERFRFVDVAKEAGLTAISWCGRPEKPHLLESGGNGIALVDYDGDGDLDVYTLSGWRLDGERVAEKPGNRLWRNRGDGTFDDVTAAAGVAGGAWANGVAVGDVDGDGRPDLYVTNFGPPSLWRNRGDGTFEAVADPPGIDGWSTGAAFFDADGDGDEDLYVAAYVDCTLQDVLTAKPTLDWKGVNVMLGPFGLEGKRDAFFRNEGGGKFTDATAESGLTDTGLYFGFGVAALDLDGDRDLDLFVANDSNPNYVYRNDGGGKFTEVGLWSGASAPANGDSQAGMGVGVGDPDADGLPDVLVTTFAEDQATLYRNLGRCLFRDAAAASGVREPTYAHLKWGVVFADLDLDGDEDVAMTNGHIYPQADTNAAAKTSYAQTSLLLEQDGGRFRDVSAAAGPGFAAKRPARGLAAGDLDGDGDADLVIANVDRPPSLLRNDSPRAGRHWLILDAPGALRVTIEAGGKRQMRHFVAGGSYLSASDPRFHFGLGESTTAKVTLVARDGRETVLPDVAADRVLRVPR